MTDDNLENLLAECLEEYHRRRALRETASAEDYRERLGGHYEEFVDLLAAERSLDEVMDPKPPMESFPRPFGSYTLLREIGGGAMGVVYEALHRDLGRKVALKVLRTGFDADPLAMERFRREARACAQVRHENVVEIYEAGMVDGHPFYAMPILSGRSLAELIRDGTVPKPVDLCRGLAGVADALDALHRAGIVHRDVKPANIMVGSDGKMILADFGLARTAASQALTQTGQALGTPLYMSPEQVVGSREEIDGRSDIYGLGVTLYEALSGRPPFKAEGFHSLMRLILTERPKPLSVVAPHVPKSAGLITLKAMEREQKDRYQSAAEMRKDLLAFSDGLPVTGRPVAAWRVFVRRHRPGLAVAAALVLLFAAGSWYLATRPGVVSVRSAPLARVTVDGKDYGRTPLEGLRLRPGDHVVLLAERGFREKQFLVPLSAGGSHQIDTDLRAEDSENPVAFQVLAEGLGIGAPSYQEVGKTRGLPDVAVWAVWPRGNVRLSDLGTFTLDIGDPAEFREDAKFELRRGGAVLWSAPLLPTATVHTVSLPPEVFAKLAVGDLVTWGLSPAEGDSETAQFRIVPEDVAVRLADVEAKCRNQPAELKCHLRTQILLDAGLDLAAFREAEKVLATCPQSARALAAMREALLRTGLQGSSRLNDLVSRIARLPAEAKRGVFGD